MKPPVCRLCGQDIDVLIALNFYNEPAESQRSKVLTAAIQEIESLRNRVKELEPKVG